MQRGNRRAPVTLAVILIAVVINTLLAKYAAIPLQDVSGAAAIYPAVAFMIAFALWFGVWGVVAAYLGCFIGAGVLNQMPLGVNFYWSLADLWEALIPLVAFTAFKADVGLNSKRDWVVLVIFGWLLNNLAGAAWGAAGLALGGVIPWSGFADMFVRWFLGNLAAVIVLTPLLLKSLTPIIQKAGLAANSGQPSAVSG